LRREGVPHANCGKLIVATNAEEDAMLAGIAPRRGERGGGMRVLNAADATRWRRTVVTSALLSPVTGIIDSHAFMLALLGDAENAGATPVFLFALLPADGLCRAVWNRYRRRRSITLCGLLVNSAGLHAPASRARMPECLDGCRPRITRKGITSPCPAGRRSRG
jgi:L-2-hydroxyglutarate oxidase LhgO